MGDSPEWIKKQTKKIKSWLINHDKFDIVRYYRYRNRYYKTNNVYELYYHILFDLNGIECMFPHNKLHSILNPHDTIEDTLEICFGFVISDVFEEIKFNEL